MEYDILNVDWAAVTLGAAAAFALGWLWYSDKMFGRKWRAGKGVPAIADAPMAPAMLAQAFGTFLLAWVVGVTALMNLLELAVLVGLAVAALVKAHGFFSGQTKAAVAIESLYVIVMVAVMILAHVIL